MGVASLVLGLLGLILSFVPGYGFVFNILSVLAIIFGSVSRHSPEQRGLGTAGLVLGIISLVWGILTTAACVGCAATTATILS